MGMNYYVVKNKPSVKEPIHLGKSSAGWLFLFQEQNQPWHDVPVIWHTYEEVCNWLKKYTVDSQEYVIIDECDEVCSYEDFVKLVQHKQQDKTYINTDNFKYCKNVNGYRFTEEDFS